MDIDSKTMHQKAQCYSGTKFFDDDSDTSNILRTPARKKFGIESQYHSKSACASRANKIRSQDIHYNYTTHINSLCGSVGGSNNCNNNNNQQNVIPKNSLFMETVSIQNVFIFESMDDVIGMFVCLSMFVYAHSFITHI